MKDINQITFCALMSALTVALMFVGSIFCYTAPLVAACCGYMNSIIANEVKFSRAIYSYFIVFFLANLFVARKAILIDYFIFSGIYPVIETKIVKIKNLLLKLFCKFIIFFICSVSIINFNLFLLSVSNMPIQQIKLMGYVAMIAWCFCFDYFLQDAKKMYRFKVKPRFVKNYC